MESGDHMDAQKLMTSEGPSKHQHHGDFVAVENLQKSELMSSAGGHQTGGNMENFLLHSGVHDDKVVPSKMDINEFILHESGAGVPHNEINHSQEQGLKENENLNADLAESSQNEESQLPSKSSDPDNQDGLLHGVEKGQSGEISAERNLEGNPNAVADSAVSLDEVRGDSFVPDENVNYTGQSNLQANESELSQEASGKAVEQVSNERKEEEKEPVNKAHTHLSADDNSKMKDDVQLEGSADKEKETVESVSKTNVIVSSDLIHSEKSDMHAGNEKSDAPVAEKHLEFISHESDVKNSDNDAINDSESKGSQFIDTEKVVSEFQKEDGDTYKSVNILQGESVSTPSVTEDEDSKPKTSDEQVASNDEKEEEWLDIVGSGQLMKKILQKAENEYRPQNGFICEINLEGRLEDGTVVEKYENMKVQVGDFEVVQGLDLALPLMNVGEVALLEVGPRFAYGTLGNLPQIPPDAKLTYQIELLSAENEPEMESLSITERRQIGDKKRERGNWWYSRKEYSFAIRSYRRALEFLDDAEEGFSMEKKEVSEDTERQFQELLEDRLKVYNNLAAAHIMNKSYDAALTSVENVLRCQPQNVKALRRKAKILAAKGETAAALSILRTASQLEPESASIKQEIQRLQDVIKRDTKQEQSLYKKMLGQTKTAEKSVPKPPKVSYRTWGIVCSSVAVVLLGAVAYRYKFL